MRKIMVVIVLFVITGCSVKNKNSAPSDECKENLSLKAKINYSEANSLLNRKLVDLNLSFEYKFEFVSIVVADNKIYYAYILKEILGEREVGILHYHVDASSGDVYDVTNPTGWKKL